MTDQHTKGPWTVRSTHYNHVIRDAAEDEVAIIDSRCLPTHEADARLIACAPELLEALEAIVAANFRVIDVEPARAVIAKAKGGAR